MWHEGQGPKQNLQQWCRLMQNGQNLSLYYTVANGAGNVNERVAYPAHNVQGKSIA